MKIKTSYLKNKEFLQKCINERLLFPEKFKNIEINAGKFQKNLNKGFAFGECRTNKT